MFSMNQCISKTQCKEVTANFEASRVAALEMKRAARKQASLPSMDVAVW